MPLWRKLHLKTTESLDLDDMPDDFHRLLWLMLPLITCREGRGMDNPAWVKSKAMPLRGSVMPDDVQQAMDWFESNRMIQRYTVAGRSYFAIVNWHKYQGDTSKEAASIYPSPDDEDATDLLPTSSGPTPDLLPTKSASDADADAEEKHVSSASADYQAIRQAWIELFPDKSKPRAENKTLQGKVRTRMKSEHFEYNWRSALERAATSAWLHSESFFDLGWFLQNDANYEKCLDGKYTDRGDVQAQTPRPPPVKKIIKIRDPVTGELIEREAIA